MSELQQALHKKHNTLYKMTSTAILISLAVVMKLFVSITIPFMGAGGMKMTMAGVVTAFPAILFGPLYGGAASALCDLIGCLINPTDAYIPWLTVTAFAGGCLKGLLWMLLRGKIKVKNLLYVLMVICLLITGTGVLSYINLSSDGVVTQFVTTKQTVPYRGEINSMSLSPVSQLITDCAKYNKDTFTLKAANDSETVILPTSVILAGLKSNISKIGEKAFAECTIMKECYIPSVYKTISDSAFGDRKDVLICGEAGSAAESFAAKNGFTFQAVDSIEEITLSYDQQDGNGYTVSSSDTYRKYLSGYVNFATVGMILSGILCMGIAFLAWIFRKSKNQDAGNNFALMAVTLTISGAFTTTINTWILRAAMTAWNGRSFMLLWIPRIIEELIVCLIQAYIVAVLYDIYVKRIAIKG